MIKPVSLKQHDTIALLAPSGGLAAIFPHRIDAATKFLKSKGFNVKEYPTSRGFLDGRSGTAEERARDLMAAFVDPEVKAIVCTIGGLYSNELLPLLDFDAIKRNPKIFCGYSDISILHYAILAKTGMVTFYGPCAMTQFGEYPQPLGYTADAFLKATMQSKALGKINASTTWTHELLDWGQKKDLERPRQLHKNEGYVWLKKGNASGQIIGGCLYSILQLKGTQYDADYTEKILFIEVPEGQDFTKGEPLAYVDSQIMDLRVAGIFDSIKGLIVGRGFGYTPEQHEEFMKIIQRHTKEYDFPVLFNANIGHADPIMTLPLNVKVTIDSERNLFSVDESGVRE